MTKQIKYNPQVEEYIDELNNNITKNKQIKIINYLKQEGLQGQELLLNFLIDRRITQKIPISFIDSLIFRVLIDTQIPEINQKIKNLFPNGIIELHSNLQINYQPLQDLLINNKFQEADKITQQYLCQLVGLQQNRQWLYFTDINLLPQNDLLMIDLLWKTYSLEKFGFSIQRQVWLSNNCDWDKLWEKIGWTKQGKMVRYPIEFNWSTDAPEGHLPLFNQLRGVQVLLAIFKHDAWQNK